jgi:DnaJ like chaperone protein
MGIFGAIVGGSIGLVMGGPIGAVVGAMFGAQVGETNGGGVRTAGPMDQATAQAVFAVALTSMAAKVAKADGRVTDAEVTAFDRFLQEHMGMSVQERQGAARVFNEARDSPTHATDYATQLGQLLRYQPDRLRDVLTILLSIAHADGELHSAEEALIRQIGLAMGLGESDYQSCLANFAAMGGQSAVDPYAVLGVERTASDVDVRAAHRRVVREYHPDILQSKGMPEEFMEFAKEKLTASNQAWAQIKKERDL